MKKIILCLSILAIILNACEKKEKTLSGKNQPYLIAQANNDVLSAGLVDLGGVCNNNGVLEFQDTPALHRVVNSLMEFDKNWKDPVDNISKNDEEVSEPEHPALDIFEARLQFRSLRRDIEDRENQALANGTFSEANDPDNHFIKMTL